MGVLKESPVFKSVGSIKIQRFVCRLLGNEQSYLGTNTLSALYYAGTSGQAIQLMPSRASITIKRCNPSFNPLQKHSSHACILDNSRLPLVTARIRAIISCSSGRLRSSVVL